MKTTLLSACLYTTVLVRLLGLTSAAVIPRSDADTIANFGRIGICLSYLGAGNTEKELAPCKIFCPAQNPGSDPNAVGVCDIPCSNHSKIEMRLTYRV